MQKSVNLFDVKNQNKKLVLDLIRRQPRSRADLAQATGLTRQAISLIVDRLLEKNLVLEVGYQEGGVGRNPITLTVNKEGAYAIGVNITRIHIEIGIANLYGEVLCQKFLPVKGRQAAECLRNVASEIKGLLQGQNIPQEKLLGIGVSAPGPLDYKTGTICNPPGFKAWHNIAVAEILGEHTGLPVRMENVADAMALEELYFGQFQEVANFLVLLVDEEIGAGIVVNDSLYRGKGGFGGEIGHTSIRFDGIPCECGNRGCLSRYAAIPELLHNSPFANWQQVIDNLHTDSQATSLLHKEAEYLATALVSALNLFDLEKVLIGGFVSYSPEMLFAEINKLLHLRVITPIREVETLVFHTDNQDGVRTAIMPLISNFYTNLSWE